MNLFRNYSGRRETDVANRFRLLGVMLAASFAISCIAKPAHSQNTIPTKQAKWNTKNDSIRISPIPPLSPKFEHNSRIFKALPSTTSQSQQNADHSRIQARVVLNEASPQQNTMRQATRTHRANQILQPVPTNQRSVNSPVSYETMMTPLATQPPTMRAPSNESHIRLANLTYEEFESRMMQTWGSRISGETFDENRTLRIKIPQTKTTPETSMVFDRLTRVLKFECKPELIPAWKKTIELLDRKPTFQDPMVVQLVDMNSAPQSHIQQVVYNLSQRQDDQTGAAPNQDKTTRAEVQLPEGGRVPLPEIISQQIDTTGLLKRVKINVIPETNVLVITGEEADVAFVKKLIESIVQEIDVTASQVDTIDLKYLSSSDIASEIQRAYDENFQTSFGSATVSPVPPSKLLVVGKPDALAMIRKIVDSFDKESLDQPTEKEYQVFRLKFISAQDAKQRIDEYYGQSGNNTGAQPPPTEAVFTIADFRSNTLFVRAGKRHLELVGSLLAELDVEDGTAEDIVRIFTVKNMAASDLALVLQDAISGQQQNAGIAFTQGQNQQQNNNQQQGQNNQGGDGQSHLRSHALKLMTVDHNGNKTTLGASGIMFDVRITTNTASNQIVVTASEKSMDLIDKLIAQLDVPPNAETQIKVFTIVNGDAEALLTMLQTLFQGDNGQGGQQGNQNGVASMSELPLQSSAAAAGNSLVNMRFTSDPRSNSIIASGPVGDLQVVEDLLIRLDEGDIQNRRVSVIRLSNAPALDVAEAIQSWLDDRDSLITQETFSNGGPMQRTRRAVIVSPELTSNSLIISAVPEYYPEIERIIQSLDRRPPMVNVKVMIAEVNLSRLEEFGVDMGIQKSLLFNSVAANDLSTRVGTGFINLDRVAGQGITSTGVGRAGGGLVLSAGSESVNLLIRALKDKNCVRILSKPQIMTTENLRGRVQIGQQVPFVTGVNQNVSGGVSNTVEFIDVGVILEITPRVSPDGMIVMFVDATNSSLGAEEEGTTIFVDNNGEAIRQRAINTANAQTTIMSRSGQTVVFSGLLREEKSAGKRGVPILSDLPYLGPLFSFQTSSAKRTELLIFLTPYLVNNGDELDMQNDHAMSRMNWCLSDVAEMYGDVNSVGMGEYGSAPKVFYPDADPMGNTPNESQTNRATRNNTKQRDATNPISVSTGSRNPEFRTPQAQETWTPETSNRQNSNGRRNSTDSSQTYFNPK